MYCKALELQPDLLKTRFSLGTLYLLLGDYEKGWELYHSRVHWPSVFRLNIPIWKGENLAGKRILLFFEQGYGDMLQGIRYVNYISQMAAEVTVWIQKPLAKLLEECQPSYNICVSSRDLKEERFDIACSIFSLPARLLSVVVDAPYLPISKKMCEKWKVRLPHDRSEWKKVGLVCAGNPEHTNDINRSFDFSLLSRFFTVKQILWINLQVGEKSKQLSDFHILEP